MAESSPLPDGQNRLTTTTYRKPYSSCFAPAKVVYSIVTASGNVVDLKTDSYTYTEADGVRRVEISSAAAGVSEPQVTIDETWLADAENVYARGRTKMSQAINGVQTHYEYAANATYGALYTVTTETRVNGATVAGQSRRSVEYIAANGNTMREEEYALLSDGETWALLSGVTNTYDEKNRLVGTLKDNGRSTSRTLNCSGQLLTETDEDGITTIYGYTNSRQLVEMTRSEVSIPAEDGTDGRIVITPEIITSYTYDALGRSTGFIYVKNGAVQHTVTTGYGTDGRISSAGFTHGGASKNFGYEYLSGSSLLHKLTMPCNMSLTQTYESTRDLLSGMAYHRGSTLVAQREYTYDILGRPTARNTARNGQTVNDTFAHNNRSELVGATVNSKEYEYAYDNIGNRQQAIEGNDVTVYDANALNQYTAISENGAVAFVPQFDADGNQTLIQSDTGIWSAVYNAENRPVTFTNSESNTVVECQYDSMGRRAYKKVTVNGSVTLH